MIQIALLQNSRNYWPLLMETLNNLDKNNRDNICLHILSSSKIEITNTPKFNYQITTFPPGLNYLNKLFCAVNQFWADYTIKLDDDIIMSTAAWEAFLRSNTLINQKTITTPIISTGIPTTDLFVGELLPLKVKEWNGLCTNTIIPRAGVWPGYEGDEYLKLNGRTSWNYKEFYKDVDRLNLYYKGIHPVRISSELQKTLNSWILNSDTIKKFNERTNIIAQKIDGPYLCNSVFMIETSLWKTILERKDLYVDAFDEVPLNRYVKEQGVDILNLRGCYAIHPYYNNVPNHIDEGYRFYEKYSEFIIR